MQYRVLFVGDLSANSTALHYFTNLVRLGHTAYPYDPRVWNTDHPGAKLVQRIRRAPSPKRVETFGQQLEQLLRENSLDLVFVMSENYVKPEWIENARMLQPQLKWAYHSHDNNFSNGILKPNDFFASLKLYDHVFTTKSKNLERYRQRNITQTTYLPSAFEPTIHQPHSVDQLLYPVSFVGTYDRSRDKVIPNIGWDRLRVWGNGWNRAPYFGKHRNAIVPHAIYNYSYAKVISASHCSLGLLREEADDLHTQRTFEIPACGALQFSPRNSEVLGLFEEDKEIVCFDNSDELNDKLGYYLKNETSRKKIAAAGHHRCLKGNHRYQDRVQTILDTVIS